MSRVWMRNSATGPANGLFAACGLPSSRWNRYRLEGELESLLGRSLPLPGDADRIFELPFQKAHGMILPASSRTKRG